MVNISVVNISFNDRPSAIKFFEARKMEANAWGLIVGLHECEACERLVDILRALGLAQILDAAESLVRNSHLVVYILIVRTSRDLEMLGLNILNFPTLLGYLCNTPKLAWHGFDIKKTVIEYEAFLVDAFEQILGLQNQASNNF